MLKRNELKKDPIPLEKFLLLRKAPNNYQVFIKDLLKGICGLKPFAERLANPTFPPDDLCTISDEAFGLVTLVNHYDQWVALFKHYNNTIPPVKSTKETKKRAKEVIKQKPTFTSGGLTPGDQEGDEDKDDEVTFVQKGKGFSKTGIECYNQFYDDVCLDRKNYPLFLFNLCTKERVRSQSKAFATRKQSRASIPEARNDFSIPTKELPFGNLHASNTSNLPENHQHQNTQGHPDDGSDHESVNENNNVLDQEQDAIDDGSSSDSDSETE